MEALPYSLNPVDGYTGYRVTALLRTYMSKLLEQQATERVTHLLQLLDDYCNQINQLNTVSTASGLQAAYKAMDDFFAAANEENKSKITCKEGCTACCFIDVDISGNEAAAIIAWCSQNNIEIDKNYLTKQTAAGRKIYSPVSRCVFLKENLCSIYPVRPAACRKLFVMTDPALCDFSENKTNQVATYFDLHTEIIASAVMHGSPTGPIEKMLLEQLDLVSNTGEKTMQD